MLPHTDCETVQVEIETPSSKSRHTVSTIIIDWLAFAVFKSIAALVWLREQWSLWMAIGCVICAYLFPLLRGSETLTNICVALVFFLSGLSFPISELLHVRRLMVPFLVASAHIYLLSPLLAVVAYLVPWSNDIARGWLLSGLLCMSVLPPPSVLPLISVASAAGSESMALYLSATGNFVGVIASPLIMQLLLFCIEVGGLANHKVLLGGHTFLPFAGNILLIIVSPLLGGIAMQYAVSNVVRNPPDEHTKRQLHSAQTFCNDVCAAGPSFIGPGDTPNLPMSGAYFPSKVGIGQSFGGVWKYRMRQVIFGVTMFMNYFMFSSLFSHSSSTSFPSSLHERNELKVTWFGVAYISGIVAAMHILLCCVAWVSSSFCTSSPEDRIALFFSCVQKSDLLAIPFVSLTFAHEAESNLAIMVVPTLIYHLIQSVTGAVLAYPMRQWRNNQHCRPGTTLLPPKFAKTLHTSKTFVPMRDRVEGKCSVANECVNSPQEKRLTY